MIGKLFATEQRRMILGFSVAGFQLRWRSDSVNEVMYIHVNVYTYMYMYVYTCTCIYMYIYMYMYVLPV